MDQTEKLQNRKRLLALLILVGVIAAGVSITASAYSNSVENATEQERLSSIQNDLDSLEKQLASGNPEEIASAWTDLVSHADIEQYRGFAEEHGGYPNEFELDRLWDMRLTARDGFTTIPPNEYLRTYRESDLDETPAKIESDDYSFYETSDSSSAYSYAYLELNSEECEELSLDDIVDYAGFEDQAEEGLAWQQYAYSGNTDLQYRFDFQYAPGTLDGEEALWVAMSKTEREADSPSGMILYCTQLGDRNIDDVISQLVLFCENSGSAGLCLNLSFIASALSDKEPVSPDYFDNEPHLEFTFNEPATNQDAQAPSQDSSATDSSKNDRVLVEEDGKSMYQVYAYSDSIDFTGEFEGSGNFIVRVLDSNQELHALVVNEIGSYVLDASVPVNEGEMYYIVIECSDGTWSMAWTGTYGS